MDYTVRGCPNSTYMLALLMRENFMCFEIICIVHFFGQTNFSREARNQTFKNFRPDDEKIKFGEFARA